MYGSTSIPATKVRLADRLPRLVGRWRRFAFGDGAGILTYHHIGAPNAYISRLGICVEAEEFSRQLVELKRRFKIVPYSEVLRHRDDRRLLALTFDDGYRSLLTTTLPILKAHDCPAKVFLNADQVDGALGWLNKLNLIVEALDDAAVAEFARRALPTMTLTEPRKIFPYWRFFEHPHTLAAIETEFASLSATRAAPPWSQLYMSRSDIVSLLAEPLLEWGSHTERHLPLDRISAEERRKAIVEGHARLRQLLGDRLSGFALPFGSPNLRRADIAADVAEIDDVFLTATNQRSWRVKVGPLLEMQRVAGDRPFDATLALLARRWRFDWKGFLHGD